MNENEAKISIYRNTKNVFFWLKIEMKVTDNWPTLTASRNNWQAKLITGYDCGWDLLDNRKICELF